jgi:preprotein translocase subunit YajC
MIRPQQKQLAEHRKFVDALQNGDKVVTDSGIFGTIMSVSGDSVILKVAENVKIKVLKTKISGAQPVEEPKGKAPAKKK